MDRFDTLHDDRTLRWCKYRYPDENTMEWDTTR